MILVFSVHADDAIFSCGEFIAQHALDESVWVVNMCATWPEGDQEALRWQHALNMEHERACAHLGAQWAHGWWMDGKWEEANRYALSYETEAVRRLIIDCERQAGEGASTILVPLGIHHPDHLYFAAALLEAVWQRPGHVAVYEDLPYRVLYPEETAERMRPFVARGDRLESIANGGFVKQKLEACALYESQWSPPEGDAPRCCSAPERIWSLR